MEFYQTDGGYSIVLVSVRHPSISLPRRLAYKRANSQPANISVQCLGFHSKSKEVRFDTTSEIHTTEYSQGTTGPSRFPTSDYQLLLSQTQVTARTFLSLLGKLSAAADFVLLDRLHLCPLQCVYCLSGDLIFLQSIIMFRLTT